MVKGYKHFKQFPVHTNDFLKVKFVKNYSYYVTQWPKKKLK